MQNLTQIFLERVKNLPFAVKVVIIALVFISLIFFYVFLIRIKREAPLPQKAIVPTPPMEEIRSNPELLNGTDVRHPSISGNTIYYFSSAGMAFYQLSP